VAIWSSTGAEYDDPFQDRPAHGYGPGLLLAAAAALAGLLASTAIAAVVALLLGAGGARSAASAVPATPPVPTTSAAATNPDSVDSRGATAQGVDQRRAGGPDEAGARIARSWLLVGLTGTARASVRDDLAAAVPAVRPILGSLAQAVSIDASTRDCPSGAPSCSYRGQGIDGRWGIHLDAQVTAATYQGNRFIVYHEIGHAVWGLLLTDRNRRDFVAAVRAALHGRPCVNGRGRPCADIQEVFADEFARYAGGFAVSMSFYWIRLARRPLEARTGAARPAHTDRAGGPWYAQGSRHPTHGTHGLVR
jgi:hypothetical protein